VCRGEKLKIPVWTKYREQKGEIERLRIRLRAAEDSSNRRYGYFLRSRKGLEDISNITDALLNIMFLMNEPQDFGIKSDYSFEQLLDTSKHELARLGDRVDLEGKLSKRCMDEEKLVSSIVDYS
jgi:hypothetical protein